MQPIWVFHEPAPFSVVDHRDFAADVTRVGGRHPSAQAWFGKDHSTDSHAADSRSHRGTLFRAP